MVLEETANYKEPEGLESQKITPSILPQDEMPYPITPQIIQLEKVRYIFALLKY